MSVTTRPWQPDDEPFLWEMLYLSIHVVDGMAPPPRSVLDTPDIAHYLREFGTREGDDAEVAIDDRGELIGAAWCRRMTADDPGYGFVGDDVPELGMAVVPPWRGKGVGRLVLETLLRRHPVMSLSVDLDNTLAARFYETLGFVEVEKVGTSMTMLRRPADLKPPRHHGDERSTLLVLLQYQRESLLRKIEGISDETARRVMVQSGTTLLWLLQHTAAAEQLWVVQRFAGREPATPAAGPAGEPAVAHAAAAYRATWDAVDAIVAESSLDDSCSDISTGDVNLRWVLMHLLEETARHAGHADILRELIDGSTGR